MGERQAPPSGSRLCPLGITTRPTNGEGDARYGHAEGDGHEEGDGDAEGDGYAQGDGHAEGKSDEGDEGHEAQGHEEGRRSGGVSGAKLITRANVMSPPEVKGLGLPSAGSGVWWCPASP